MVRSLCSRTEEKLTWSWQLWAFSWYWTDTEHNITTVRCTDVMRRKGRGLLGENRQISRIYEWDKGTDRRVFKKKRRTDMYHRVGGTVVTSKVCPSLKHEADAQEEKKRILIFVHVTSFPWYPGRAKTKPHSIQLKNSEPGFTAWCNSRACKNPYFPKQNQNRLILRCSCGAVVSAHDASDIYYVSTLGKGRLLLFNAETDTDRKEYPWWRSLWKDVPSTGRSDSSGREICTSGIPT